MNLDSMAITVRPRQSFEALDHGLLIARRFARPALVAWLMASVPVLVASFALISFGYDTAGSLLLWWFKPYYDRAVLVVYSRGVFGAAPGWRDIARALPGLWDRGLWWQLTLARFSPSRSFVNPVRQLEGLRGAPLRQRLNSLSRRAGSHAIALLFVFANLEFVFGIGVLLLVVMFLPQAVQVDVFAFLDLELVTEVSFWFSVVMLALYFVTITVLEPLYVASGFALYLNQRTILEGWDLELGLRRLAARIAQARAAATGSAARSAASLVAAALVALTLLHGTPDARAAISSEPLADPATPAEQVAERAEQLAGEVLADEIFDHREVTTRLKPRFEFDDDSAPSTPFELPDWLTGLFGGTYTLIKGIFLIALVAVIAWLLLRLAPYLRRTEAVVQVEAPVDGETGLLDVQALPARPLEQVRALWQAGRTRDALALLYRATLDAEARLGHLRFPDSATEREALRLVRAQGGPRVEVFRDATRAWQEQAYAHRAPDETRTVSLFDRWQAAYE